MALSFIKFYALFCQRFFLGYGSFNWVYGIICLSKFSRVLKSKFKKMRKGESIVLLDFKQPLAKVIISKGALL